MKYNAFLYETVDSLFKTRLKLDTLGKMLNQAGVLDKKYLKTDFDYLKYTQQTIFLVKEKEDDVLKSWVLNRLKKQPKI